MNKPKRPEVCTIHHNNGIMFEIMAYHELSESEREERVSLYLKTNPPKAYEARLDRKDTDSLCDIAKPLIKDFTSNGESSMDSRLILSLTRSLFVFFTESLIFMKFVNFCF